MPTNTRNLIDTNPCPRCSGEGLSFCKCGGPGGGGGSNKEESASSKKYENSHQSSTFDKHKNTNLQNKTSSIELTLSETKRSEDTSEQTVQYQKTVPQWTSDTTPFSLTPPVKETTHQEQEEEVGQKPFSPTPFSMDLNLLKK